MRRARVRSQGPEEPITDIRRRAPLVLVVEDAPDVREMYADYFGLSGFRTAVAADGVEAVEKSVALHPDVVIMDLALPRLDGWEATRRIRQHAANVPIVAVSGFTSEAHVSAARDAGCDDFIAKPALPQQVLARVRTLLRCALRLRRRRYRLFLVVVIDDRDLRDRELVGDRGAVGEVPFRGRRLHAFGSRARAAPTFDSRHAGTREPRSMPRDIVAPRHEAPTTRGDLAA